MDKKTIQVTSFVYSTQYIRKLVSFIYLKHNRKKLSTHLSSKIMENRNKFSICVVYPLGNKRPNKTSFVRFHKTATVRNFIQQKFINDKIQFFWTITVVQSFKY